MNQEKLDPVYRCDSCQKIITLDILHKIGCCNHCGNKRVRNVTVFDENEMNQMKSWGLDEFLAGFECIPLEEGKGGA
jgi:DNA-directed RNA polymerase subunit RPC12/RpoP